MHRIARSFSLLGAVLIAGTTLLVLPVGVGAQNNGTPAAAVTPVPTPAPTPTPLVTDDATAIQLEPAMALTLVLVLLLLALFALSEIFRYLRDGREDYYRTFREFARKGVYLTPVMVNATATQSRVMEGAGGAELAPVSEVFEMTGPGSLVTGDRGVYTARLGTGPATQTVWRLSDADDADVPAQNATLEMAPDGASATLTASKAGVYVVGASPATNPSLRVRTAVTVVDPPAADGEVPPLPFIGEGYGSIVGAILLLAVVVVLAATRAIDADIIGVLLGSIAGYLFGVGMSRSSG